MQDCDDFVVRDATHGPDGSPLVPGRLCSKCGRVKPLAEFKRKLSRAQSMARGHAGNFRLEIESTMCKACQPREKSYSEMTRKEIENRIATGDIHALVAKEVLEKRQRALAAEQRRYISQAWKAARTESWSSVLGDVRDELARVQQQEKYAKNKYPDIPLDFFFEYKQLLAKTREAMKYAMNIKGEGPTFTDWLSHVERADADRLRDLWEGLPMAYREKVRQPTIVLWDGFKGEQAPKPSIRKLPSAAERLAYGKKKPT